MFVFFSRGTYQSSVALVCSGADPATVSDNKYYNSSDAIPFHVKQVDDSFVVRLLENGLDMGCFTEQSTQIRLVQVQFESS